MFAITWVLSLCVSLLPLGLAFYCAYYDCEYSLTEATGEQILVIFFLHFFTHLMYQIVGAPSSPKWMRYVANVANLAFVTLMWVPTFIIAFFYGVVLLGYTNTDGLD